MTSIDEIGSKLHSAEHMFARSLQNLGLDIHVRKADTFRPDLKGIVYIKEIIPIDKVRLAEEETNRKISENLKVSEKTFESLAEALKENPSLRFNEERLGDKGTIRVIKIGDFDVCACKNKHVAESADIGPFVITKVSYLGGQTELQFKIGEQAKEHLMEINSALVDSAYEWNFDPVNVHAEISRLKKDVLENKRGLSVLASRLLETSKSSLLEVDDPEINVFLGALERFKNDNPSGFRIILSKNRLVAIKGMNSGFGLKALGESLKSAGAFLGDLRQDYLNGKVVDYEKVKKQVIDAVDKSSNGNS